MRHRSPEDRLPRITVTLNNRDLRAAMDMRDSEVYQMPNDTAAFWAVHTEELKTAMSMAGCAKLKEIVERHEVQKVFRLKTSGFLRKIS